MSEDNFPVKNNPNDNDRNTSIFDLFKSHADDTRQSVMHYKHDQELRKLANKQAAAKPCRNRECNLIENHGRRMVKIPRIHSLKFATVGHITNLTFPEYAHLGRSGIPNLFKLDPLSGDVVGKAHKKRRRRT